MTSTNPTIMEFYYEAKELFTRFNITSIVYKNDKYRTICPDKIDEVSRFIAQSPHKKHYPKPIIFSTRSTMSLEKYVYILLCKFDEDIRQILPLIDRKELDDALIYACGSGNIDAVGQVIELGLPVNAIHGGVTALHVAIDSREMAIVNKLLNHGADPRLSGCRMNPMKYAIRTLNKDWMGINSNHEGNSRAIAKLLVDIDFVLADYIDDMKSGKAYETKCSSEINEIFLAAKNYNSGVSMGVRLLQVACIASADKMKELLPIDRLSEKDKSILAMTAIKYDNAEVLRLFIENKFCSIDWSLVIECECVNIVREFPDGIPIIESMLEDDPCEKIANVIAEIHHKEIIAKRILANEKALDFAGYRK